MHPKLGEKGRGRVSRKQWMTSHTSAENVLSLASQFLAARGALDVPIVRGC
jgi:hypothetical protein